MKPIKLARALPTLLIYALLLAVPARAESPASDAGSAPASGSSVADLLSSMDRSADPCQDFYRYACGGWLDKTELPSDETRWARSFSVINERNREIVRQLLAEAAADPGDGGERQKIGYFYGSCMDEAAIEKAGTKPLEPFFAEIAKVRDASTLLSTSGKLYRQGVPALLRMGALPDFKNPGQVIAFFGQGGLGMPDRDYYVSEDEKKRELLQTYQAHVAKMLELAGASAETAASQAVEIVAFEKGLAEASRPRAEMRNAEKLYNKIDLEGLQKLSPSLPWQGFLAAAGYGQTREINVATPEFFEALEKLATATPPETLQAYLRWQTISNFADALPADFVNANFEFFGKALSGQQSIEPRWKRCVEATSGALGEAIGKLYVETNFPGSSKQIALEMVGDIEAAFSTSLPQLQWMDEATRARALEKLAALNNKIGYPDQWRDYSALEVGKTDYFANALAATEVEFDRQMRKIGKPVDRGEWGMTPQTVNAYYNPLLNEIAFPAGILQPPFFHRDQPAPMNYGGIGAVIGHELSHGFDDQGRKFDPSGQLREWWQPEVAEKFEHQAQCIRDQYDRYEIEPGVAVQGQLTLGENIADIGGLKQSYRAFKLWQERNGSPPSHVEGLSDDQLFFLSYGQVWCVHTTPEVARLRVTVDPHSPPQFRIVGAISNHPDFAEAFGCKPGDPMVPKTMCEVW